MTSHQHALGLLRCFEGYVARNDDEANRAHLGIAREWVRLLESDRPSSADIESLLTAVKALPNAGSATCDLRLGVNYWASRARRKAILREQFEKE